MFGSVRLLPSLVVGGGDRKNMQRVGGIMYNRRSSSRKGESLECHVEEERKPFEPVVVLVRGGCVSGCLF